MAQDERGMDGTGQRMRSRRCHAGCAGDAQLRVRVSTLCTSSIFWRNSYLPNFCIKSRLKSRKDKIKNDQGFEGCATKRNDFRFVEGKNCHAILGPLEYEEHSYQAFRQITPNCVGHSLGADESIQPPLLPCPRPSQNKSKKKWPGQASSAQLSQMDESMRKWRELRCGINNQAKH
jgi:hypothetical protein